ncbi:AAA family ATPase [Streptomyces sp. NPDC056568]|uniref:helix-turn-helix transcriptional regulator n=1 Tax=Streptomyces sp. NPDC056568 TaxID=3345866 RepID=UPI0036C7B752
MTGGSGDGPAEGSIVGRTEELARLERMLSEPLGATPLIVVGEPGSGKSTLLEAVAASAGRRGWRVVGVRGEEGAAELAFAGLHRLLLPVRDGLAALPSRQRAALGDAWGLDADGTAVSGEPGAVGDADEPGAGDEPPEALLIPLAAWTLLSEAGRRRPLFLVVDDAQWLDAGSLDALAFLARRLADEPVALLAGARDGDVPPQLGGSFDRLPVRPLSDDAANRLLDRQAEPPAGRLRERVLRQAAGNPLALVELARSAAEHAAGSGSPFGAGAADPEVLPLTERLERLFAARLAELPEATRRALLIVAAAGSSDLPTAPLLAAATTPDALPDPWSRAEQAGLVRLDSAGVRFRHPLVRSAVYQTASFADRRQAHLALAHALTGHPDRRAWHLAAATLTPDEEVAAGLVATADRARRRGGYHAAAMALERAAELSPLAEDQARRLVGAAETAMYAGRPRRVEALAAKAAAATDDPHLLAAASTFAGWALAVTPRHAACLDILLPLAESSAPTAPDRALAALSTAANVVYNAGDERSRGAALRIAKAAGPTAGTDAQRLWTSVACDPFAERQERVLLLGKAAAVPDRPLPDLVLLGGTAFVLDETDTAINLLGGALNHLRRTTTAGSNATVAQALASAQFDTGAWESADALAQEARHTAVEDGLEVAAASAGCVTALLRVARGDTETGRAVLRQALSGIDLSRSRGLASRARMILGTAAAVDGHFAVAYEQVRGLFTEGPRPRPLHYHLAHYGIADLATAAVRADRADDARRVLAVTEEALSGSASVRLAALLHRARAALADPAEAEPWYEAALADPAGEQWPFERARARLEYAQWLRRRRRTGDAARELVRALAVFERLGARPWADVAGAELRACGIAPPASEPRPAGAGELTGQQLRIVQLAAEGLTNREIGERMLLSPRTVGFHLYQAFPKLGVSGRGRLRGALDRLGRE